MAIRTNYINKNDYKQICKWKWYRNRHETGNLIIKEYNKLAQKEYKSSYDWVGKVIHWELCKRLKFSHTDKWYMYKPKSVLENGSHKVILGFEKKKLDHLIPDRRFDSDN